MDAVLYATLLNQGFARRTIESDQTLLKPHVHSESVCELLIDSNRNTLTISRDGTAKIWSYRSLDELATATANLPGAFSGTISPNGTFLLVGYQDGSIGMWEFKVPSQVDNQFPSVAFVGDSTRVTSGVYVWDADDTWNHSLRHLTPPMIRDIGTDHQGRWVVVGDEAGNLRVLRRDDAHVVRQWQAHEQQINTLSLHPQESHLVSGSTDGKARLWDWTSGRLTARFTCGMSARESP